MMARKAKLAGFLAACSAIVVVALAIHRPSLAADWPDYSATGPGFLAPTSPDGELIAYGYRLVSETFALIGPEAPAAAGRFAGNNLACQNCHLDGGTNRAAVPLVGVFRIYPRFSARSGRVISLAERINECMTRSMHGRPLPGDSREMAGYLAYLKFIGEPEAAAHEPAPAAERPPDAAHGQEVFDRLCAACHQADGLGKRRGVSADARGYEFPPLWGPDSFNDGAGMDHFERAVRFIRHNMPRGVDPDRPVLTLQEAWDAAALLQSRQRPHYEPPR
jgi:thiosulfate dehydrogenase